ncbi:ADP-ribosylglycohydrolase family protein [Collinsella sp. AGMB00827]|uniref:ADP-ribosylglycohydrolase family protein n=1 Tax=Collinsella ureilytica TaxID=2869515 RepID=A0ABS7MK12_9ACTN|nr:ADP-ribosylglycohydrolase family protein [Collinsella urealyticum]MBY4797378.1 ADP-ribosylglycohydrolase family protein [Collinsella urealyticum]
MEEHVIKHPSCGSRNIAEILWGLPSFTDELQKKLSEGKAVPGGRCVDFDDPKYECNDCLHRFEKHTVAEDLVEIVERRRLKGIIYGAAVGDALGVPYEFQGRDSFTCKGMASGGVHQMPEGTFSDDTSMLLATQDSIRERGRIDVEDMRERFRRWLYEGAYTADGKVFDVGNATATALSEGHGMVHEYSNGNGSLMRIAPLACTDATDDEIRAVSAITHAHPISKEACVLFVHVLRNALENGADGIVQVIEDHLPDDARFRFLADIVAWPRERVRSTGYVLDTLGAALWCAWNTDSYEECVLAAVNLGDDTDTTACVAGALAGAMYGYDSICKSWIEQLRGKEVINRCIFGQEAPVQLNCGKLSK